MYKNSDKYLIFKTIMLIACVFCNLRMNPESTAWVFSAGGISGMLSWAFTYPQDVIKSKIQADNLGPNAKYKGYLHCYKMTVEKHGYGILTRGMASSLIR